MAPIDLVVVALFTIVLATPGAAGSRALLWSPVRLFDKSHITLPKIAPADATCLDRILTGSSPCLSGMFGRNLDVSPPHVLVLFQAIGSGSIPYMIGAYAGQGAPTIFDSLTQSETVVEITDDSLSPEIFSSDGGFLIVNIDKSVLSAQNVALPSFRDAQIIVNVDTDSLSPVDVHTIIDMVNDKYSGRYIGLFNLPQQQRPFAALAGNKQSPTGQEPGPQPSDYITVEILAGIVISFLMIGAFLLFFNLLAKIETPPRFQRQHFDVSKEY